VIDATRSRELGRGNILAALGGVMCTRTVAAVAVATALAGCFYVDPINERPSADIERVEPELPFRGDPIEVYAEIFDPDGDPTHVTWQAFACTDEDCDDAPSHDGIEYTFEFDAPIFTISGVPATRVHVELQVEDELGARTAPGQSLDINLANRDPSLAPLQPDGLYYENAFPLATTVIVEQEASDGDDPPETLAFLTPELRQVPVGATAEDIAITRVDPAPEDGAGRWEIDATVAGTWVVRFAVVDPLGRSAVADETIVFAEDRAPCIRVADPGFPPDGLPLPIDEPTRFAVSVVDDDLDLFPAPPADPDEVRGAASFRWYLADPSTGGELEPLDVDGNQLDLDPDNYDPGDLLELRVEAVDRVDRPLCDSALPSCEDVGRPGGCFQRRTWLVEVR
jgi:hypothetical protein